MWGGMNIDAGKIQDAYHYALYAAGGVVDGIESSFCDRYQTMTRSAAIRLAVKAANASGLPHNRRNLRVGHAEEFARAIKRLAAAAGIDAYTTREFATGRES